MILFRSGYRFALDLATSGRPASSPGTAVGICGRVSSEDAEYGSSSSSSAVPEEEMGQMKASTECRWVFRTRSSLARNCDAVVPRGSMDPVKNKTPCFPVFNVLQLGGLLLVNCLITYELVLLLVGSLLFLPRFLFYTIL